MDGEFVAAVDHLLSAVAELQTAAVDALTHEQVLAFLDAIKQASWALPSVEHRLTARLAEASPHDLGVTSIRELLADRLRISAREAGERLTDAAQLGPRHTLTGDRVATELSHTAAAVARGEIGVAHVRIIQEFVKKLPVWVSFTRREDYESLSSFLCRSSV